MTTFNKGLLTKMGSTLEDAFFLKQDAILIEKMREMTKMKKSVEQYAKVTGIKNQKVLEKFYQMDLPVDIVAALAVVPLIEVAWADGKVDEKEKSAILGNCTSFSVEKGGLEYQLVEQWLSHKPAPNLFDAWTAYIDGICHELNDAEKKVLKETLLGHVYDVAKASGGFLGTGLGSKVSSGEQKVIDRLSSAFACS